MATDDNSQRSEQQRLLATLSDTESSAAESAAEDNGDERSRLLPSRRAGEARGMSREGRIEEEMSVLREVYLNTSFPEDADDEDSVTAETNGSTGPSVSFKRQKSPLHGNKLAKGDPGEDFEPTENQSKVVDSSKKVNESVDVTGGPKDLPAVSAMEGDPALTDLQQKRIFPESEASPPSEDTLLTTDKYGPNKHTALSSGNVYKPGAEQVRGETASEGEYLNNPQVEESRAKRLLDNDDEQIEKEATPLLPVDEKPLVFPKAGEFQIGQAGGAKGSTNDENLTMAAQDGGDSTISPGVAKIQHRGVSVEGEGTVVLEDDDGKLAYYETAVADEYGYLHKHGFPLLKETSKTLTINNPTLKQTSSSYKKNDPTILEGEYRLMNPGLDLKYVPSTYTFSKPERKTIPTSFVHQIPVIEESIKTYQKNIPESLRVESTYTRNIPVPKEIRTTFAKSVPIKKETPTTFKKTEPQLRLSSSSLNYRTPSLKSIGATYNFTTPILEESQLQSTHSLPALFQTQSSYSKSTPSLKNISLTLLKSTPSLLEVQHNFVHNKPRLRQPERVIFSNSLPEIHKPAIPPSMRHNNPVFREEPPAIWLFNTPEKEIPETAFFDFKPVLEAPVITHLHPKPMLTTGDAEHVFELNEPVLDE